MLRAKSAFENFDSFSGCLEAHETANVPVPKGPLRQKEIDDWCQRCKFQEKLDLQRADTVREVRSMLDDFLANRSIPEGEQQVKEWIDTARVEHERALRTARAEHERALRTARAEHERALRQLRSDLTDELETQRQAVSRLERRIASEQEESRRVSDMIEQLKKVYDARIAVLENDLKEQKDQEEEFWKVFNDLQSRHDALEEEDRRWRESLIGMSNFPRAGGPPGSLGCELTEKDSAFGSEPASMAGRELWSFPHSPESMLASDETALKEEMKDEFEATYVQALECLKREWESKFLSMEEEIDRLKEEAETLRGHQREREQEKRVSEAYQKGIGIQAKEIESLREQCASDRCVQTERHRRLVEKGEQESTGLLAKFADLEKTLDDQKKQAAAEKREAKEGEEALLADMDRALEEIQKQIAALKREYQEQDKQDTYLKKYLYNINSLEDNLAEQERYFEKTVKTQAEEIRELQSQQVRLTEALENQKESGTTFLKVICDLSGELDALREEARRLMQQERGGAKWSEEIKAFLEAVGKNIVQVEFSGLFNGGVN